MNKEDFYHDFLLIRKMRAPTNKRYRMLGELFAVNPDAWRVIGITEAAVKVFAKHNFKRVSRHKDPEIQFLKETLDKFVPVCYISV